MVEEKTKTEEKKEETIEEKTESSGDLVDRANDAAERLETANKKTEELLIRREELDAKETLRGKAEGGKEPEKKEEVIDNKQYAKDASEGKLNESEKDKD